MMQQASWPCSLRLFAALAIVSAPAMIFVDAGDDFRLLDVWKWEDELWIEVMFKFQGPAPLHTTVENADGVYIRDWEGTIFVTANSPAENMTVVFKLQDVFYSVVLNAFDIPPTVEDQRPPSVNKTQTVPAVDLTFPNVTYSAGDDAAFDVEVTSGGVAGSGAVYDLSFKTYVKKDDEVIGDGGKDLLTVSDKTQQDDRAVFQVDLDTEDEPQGLAVIEASVGFQPDVSPVVRAIKVKKIVEFYSTEKGSVLDDGSLEFFRGKSRYSNVWPQTCDKALPECTISCIVFSREPVVDFNMRRMVDYRNKRLDVVEETDFGVIRKLLFTTSDFRFIDDWRLTCTAKAGEQAKFQEQQITISFKRRPTLRDSLNAAELHANQTLEVRCVAHGLPVPDITITTDDDPSQSLWDRFPAESSSMWTEIGDRNQVRYMLNKPSFTSSLNSVTCTASNGLESKAEAVLQVVPVA